MGRPITCDPHGGEHLADIMVSDLGNGNVQAFCHAAFAELTLAMASAMVEAEAQQAADEAAQRLAGAPAPAPDPATARVVRRGTSRSRRAHEARKRAEKDHVTALGDEPAIAPDETPIGELVDGGAEIAGG